MKINKLLILITVFVVSLVASKKQKIGKWRRQYEELDQKYSRLAKRQQQQADQLYRVTDGLKSLCQSLLSSPWDSEETNEPDITASFTEVTSPPPITHKIVNGLHPLLCRVKYETRVNRYEVDFEAESKPDIFWYSAKGRIIQDNEKNTINNNFENFKGTTTLVSVDKLVSVNIILGPVQYDIEIEATHHKPHDFEVDLKSIGVNVGKIRRKEFVLGDILEFIVKVPKSLDITGSFSIFHVIDRSKPLKAKEFSIEEGNSGDTGPFNSQTLDSTEFNTVVFTLDTGKHNMEGVFTQEVTINVVNDSQPKITLTESQSVMFYQANRSSPYPEDIAAFIDHTTYRNSLCVEGEPCLIDCKALGSLLGDVYITRDGKHPEFVSAENDQIKLWGGIHRAVFTIERFDAHRDEGNYTCQARSQFKAAVTQSVRVTRI